MISKFKYCKKCEDCPARKHYDNTRKAILKYSKTKKGKKANNRSVKKYRNNNKEKVKEWGKKYRDNNKEKIKERNRKYRMKVKLRLNARNKK